MMTPNEAASRTLCLPNKPAYENIQTLFREAGLRGAEYRDAVARAWAERNRLLNGSRNQESPALPDNPDSRASTGLK